MPVCRESQDSGCVCVGGGGGADELRLTAPGAVACVSRCPDGSQQEELNETNRATVLFQEVKARRREVASERDSRHELQSTFAD